jgi:hypothetical protein
MKKTAQLFISLADETRHPQLSCAGKRKAGLQLIFLDQAALLMRILNLGDPY